MTSSLVPALLGIIGGILVVLLGVLVAMVMDLKKDIGRRDDQMRTSLNKTSEDLNDKIDAIQQRLTHMVLSEDYKEDKKETTLKLDEHGDRILLLETRVKEKNNG